MDILILVFGGIIIGGLIFVIMKLNQPKNSQEFSELLQQFKLNQETRHRETESIRNELRETTRNLQDQFFKVNRTVDTKLSESTKQLNERLDKSSQVIGHLQKELGKMGEIGSKIENLDKILRAPKGRGSMGEESLEEILRSIFPGNLWERQFPIPGAGVVDAAIKTTSGIIPIDAKFPLPAFERLVNAENEAEAEAAQKAFKKDVKLRINEVSKYVRPETETMDFAILFLPNENIYYEAAIRSGELSEYAKTKKVLLAGPNNMIYILQVIFQAYQSQEFAKEAQKALSFISGVKKQAEKLDDSIGVLAKHIGNANAKIGDVERENQKLQNQIDQAQNIQGSLEKSEEPNTLL